MLPDGRWARSRKPGGQPNAFEHSRDRRETGAPVHERRGERLDHTRGRPGLMERVLVLHAAGTRVAGVRHLRRDEPCRPWRRSSPRPARAAPIAPPAAIRPSASRRVRSRGMRAMIDPRGGSAPLSSPRPAVRSSARLRRPCARRGRCGRAARRRPPAPTCRRVVGEVARRQRGPHVEQRLHDRPAHLHHVGALEERGVADHAVVQQPLVAGAGHRPEVVLVVEPHVDVAETQLRPGHLGAEAERDAFLGLDAEHELVRLQRPTGVSRNRCSGARLNWMVISVQRFGSTLPVRR
jgi:hypothetical protein